MELTRWLPTCRIRLFFCTASTAALDSARVRTFYEHAFVPERAKFIAFADAHVVMHAAIFLNRQGPHPEHLEDLAGLRLGVSSRQLRRGSRASIPRGS